MGAFVPAKGATVGEPLGAHSALERLLASVCALVPGEVALRVKPLGTDMPLIVTSATPTHTPTPTGGRRR